MTAGMAFGLFMIAIILIGGLISGLAVKAVMAFLPEQIHQPRYRRWAALLALIGCFAWYPLHGHPLFVGFFTSFVFAMGMCTVILL